MTTPEGFQPLFRTSPVLELIGPNFSRGTGQDMVLGLRAEVRHCNARGTVHGGILATLADVALGYVTASASDPPASLVTVNLSLDYTGAARIGDWLETRIEIQRQTSRLAFANGYIVVNDARIVRVSAVFLVVDQQARSGT
jgi:uncharacterized protein (TIGR00369 family)